MLETSVSNQISTKPSIISIDDSIISVFLPLEIIELIIMHFANDTENGPPHFSPPLNNRKICIRINTYFRECIRKDRYKFLISFLQIGIRVSIGISTHHYLINFCNGVEKINWNLKL